MFFGSLCHTPPRCLSIDPNLKRVTQTLTGKRSELNVPTSLLCSNLNKQHYLFLFLLFFRETLEIQVDQELLENQGNQENQEIQYVLNKKIQTDGHMT